MRLYDRVKQVLENEPQTRNSDKLLIWKVWEVLHFVNGMFDAPDVITKAHFMGAPTEESVTRARRKVQELHPELGATAKSVKARRDQKEATKGTFIFREEV